MHIRINHERAGRAATSPLQTDATALRPPFAGAIALDGPPGAGTAAVAQRLAQQLRARYLDTGAMYRAATLAVLRAGIAVEDTAAVAQAAALARISISTNPRRPGIALADDPVDEEIRTAEVSAAVSAVAAVPAVREQLLQAQRHIVGLGGIVGIVLAGQDIGTTVWRAARPKAYLTATPQERARRRFAVLGDGADLAAVAADITRRERLDSTRAASPLTRAADAIELDITGLTMDIVVQRLVDITTRCFDDRVAAGM